MRVTTRERSRVSTDALASSGLIRSLGRTGAGGQRGEIFHLSGAERLSRWAIGELLAELELGTGSSLVGVVEDELQAEAREGRAA